MRVVNIIGGIGNQMFQYAFALALKEKNPNENVLIDKTHFKTLFFHDFKGMNLHEGFVLDKAFPFLSIKDAGGKELRKVSRYIPNYVLSRLARKYLPPRKSEIIQNGADAYNYDEALLTCKGDFYYEGYWQSIQYVNIARASLMKEFAHGEPNAYNRDLIERISNSNSVGIHVRRGDYVTNPAFGGICDLEYYKKAIEKIEPEGKTFFVFSNDTTWCEESIYPLLKGSEAIIVNGNKGQDSFWDMHLLSYCKQLIIANSSFSWWGAVLNKNNPMVVAPKKWNNHVSNPDLYDPKWVRI